MAMAALPSGTVTSTILIGLIVYVFVIIIRNVVRYFQWKSFFDNLPGYTVDQKHWFKGHLPLLLKDGFVNVKEFEVLVTKFPRLFRIWFGCMRPSVLLVHPETAKIVLKTADPKPLGSTGLYTTILPWLGEGLLLAGGPKWARSRRLLTPAFHFDILKPYQDIFNNCTNTMLEIIDKHAESGESFELFSLISNCTLDIILQCAFSYKTNCQNLRNQHFYCKAVTDAARMAVSRFLTPLYVFETVWNNSKPGKKFKATCDIIHDVADEVIANRKKILEEGKQEKKKLIDFLDILLTAKDETGAGLAPEDIRTEVDTFLFEGHDTTTSAITWILYELAKHPDFLKQCQEEVDNVLKNNPGFVRWDDLGKFEFMTQCIKEGMRLHTPVPAIGRESSQPYTIDGITFPEKTNFIIQVYALHHNPTVWPQPNLYDPSRFSKSKSGNIDSFAFIPFSAGPRNCIGQHFAMNEEKTIIAKILERFSLEVDPNHEVEHQMQMVMRSKNGIKCFARRRTCT